MDDTEFYMLVCLWVAIFIIAFLLLRVFFCWYWKINKRIALLEKQNELLEEILTQLRKAPEDRQ